MVVNNSIEYSGKGVNPPRRAELLPPDLHAVRPTTKPPCLAQKLSATKPLGLPSSSLQRWFDSRMGIPMDDNIHAPTVASGPTTGRTQGPDLAKLSVIELMQEKQKIEEELSALSSVLSSVSLC